MSTSHNSRGTAITADKFPIEKYGLNHKVALSLAAIVAAVSFAVYFNALYCGFIQYDDFSQVLKNRWITDISYIPEIFLNSTAGFQAGSASDYYRPVMYLSYMVCYSLSGTSPWGFHLANILVHVGLSVLVFLIAARINQETSPPTSRRRYYTAFIAAMLFATHPVHTEAVTWVAGIDETIFTFFFLLSFYFYLKLADGSSPKWHYALSILFFFIAALSKETALVLPALIAAYDYARKKSGFLKLQSLIRYIPYLLVAGIYLFIRYKVLGFLLTRFNEHPDIGFINIFPLFLKYLLRLLFPVRLQFLYQVSQNSSASSLMVVTGILVSVLFLVAVFLSARKNRHLFLCLSFIVIPLLPPLDIYSLGTTIFCERYLYLPSFGFAMLLALLIDRATKSRPGYTAVLAACIIMAFSVGTVLRNNVWRDGISLWTDQINKSPGWALPHRLLGDELKNHGKLDDALKEYQIAIQMDPNVAATHNNLGTLYLMKGWDDKAIEQFEISIKLRPDLAIAHDNLGMAYSRKGLVDKEIEQYGTFVRLNPYLAEAHNHLGIAYFSKGMIDESIEQLEIAVKIDPSLASARINLGVGYERRGEFLKAMQQYRAALHLEPDNEKARRYLADDAARLGQ